MQVVAITNVIHVACEESWLVVAKVPAEGALGMEAMPNTLEFLEVAPAQLVHRSAMAVPFLKVTAMSPFLEMVAAMPLFEMPATVPLVNMVTAVPPFTEIDT